MRNISIRIETLAFIASVFFTIACNGPFWAMLAATRPLPLLELSTLILFTGVLITGLQWLLLLLVLNRWTAKPILWLLFLSTAPAVYFMANYGVYLDKSMIRNVFETDALEAAELIDWKIIPYLLLYGVLPAFVISRFQFVQQTFKKALQARAIGVVFASLMIGVGLWSTMDSMVPMMREHREARYLVTPANFVISTLRLAKKESYPLTSSAPKAVAAQDAARVVHTAHKKPQAFVLVVGETVRAQNWGLSGYKRQTTPQLALRDVINFKDVTSCGTDTATSLPCMLSLYGRRQYDEEKIRNTESVLHVLNRVGVSVLWRDNQSGCKGTCSGLSFEDVSVVKDASLCKGKRCYDEVLLRDLKKKIDTSEGDVLIVLHMLGMHGPAYYERYPESYRKFTPTCDTTDLSRCERQRLVNTYDNGILYTDSVLDKVIAELANIQTHETGMLYVSDHGESLGEGNLFLHGLPYALAPKEQTQVPLTMWLSPRLMADHHLTRPCLSQRSETAASHDNVVHTLLGIFDVRTSAYDPSLDLGRSCPTV